MLISAIIPAYNEEERIGKTIKYLKKAIQNYNHEIIVVDDGSKDKTGKISQINNALVVPLPANMGKGKAVNHGLQLARGNIILLIDADLEKSAELIEPLVIPVINGQADMTIAHFSGPAKKGGFGFVKSLASLGLYLCTGKRYFSPISGQRVLRREVIDKIGAFKPGWGMEVAMTIDAYFSGFKILEVPLNLSHRETGRSLKGFIHRGQQFKEIFYTLIQAYWYYCLKKGGTKK